MTSPTPIDGLVWSYHCLGWSTRRIAGEVNTSQATVVRILERLRKDPPSENSTVIMANTPPSGVPAYPVLPPAYEEGEEDRYPRPRPPAGTTLVLVLTLVLLGALAATLAAANGGLIARGKTGMRGPSGPQGPPGPQRTFELCVRYSQLSGDVVSLTAPVDGRCGTATLIRVP